MKVTELLSRSSVQTLSHVRLSGREDLKSPEVISGAWTHMMNCFDIYVLKQS